jgi:hypothetical protein
VNFENCVNPTTVAALLLTELDKQRARRLLTLDVTAKTAEGEFVKY